MGYNSYLHVCLTETCSIYRLGISRLGVCHVVDGLISVLIGAGLMWLNQGTIWSGIGVWTGLPVMITGVVCLFSRQRKSRGKFSGLTLMCLLAMAVSGFLFATSAYNIDRVVVYTGNITIGFPSYKLEDDSPLLICNSLLLFFSLFEFVVSIWSAAISVGMVCMCCHLGRDRVFTIPYEGMDNEGPHGPDIVPHDRPTTTTINTTTQRLPSSSAFMEELDDSGLPHFPGPDLVQPPRRGGLLSQGARSRHGAPASSTAPPVLQIDMEMEWDEMTMPGGEEVVDTADFVNPQGIGGKLPGGRW